MNLLSLYLIFRAQNYNARLSYQFARSLQKSGKY